MQAEEQGRRSVDGKSSNLILRHESPQSPMPSGWIHLIHTEQLDTFPR
jgi:hypothetical protein